MTRDRLIQERDGLLDRVKFLDVVIGMQTKKQSVDTPYGCQQYPADRMCRFDRRAIDRKCNGCQRTTDRDYLKSMGLWVNGVSHRVDFQ